MIRGQVQLDLWASGVAIQVIAAVDHITTTVAPDASAAVFTPAMRPGVCVGNLDRRDGGEQPQDQDAEQD